MTMTVKKVPARSVLRSSFDITLAEIPAIAEKTIPALMQEAESNGLELVGPVEFTYIGCDGKPETTFELIISLPIKKRKKTAKTNFKQARTKAFKCATSDHYGSIALIGNSYGILTTEMHDAGLKATDECREVYTNWESFDSPNNITEIQVGIHA